MKRLGVLLALVAACAWGADGDLDPAFGGTGSVTLASTSAATDVALQPGGKIVVTLATAFAPTAAARQSRRH